MGIGWQNKKRRDRKARQKGKSRMKKQSKKGK